MSKTLRPIDFVVTWLDSTDEEWQRQFAYYKEQCTGRTEAARFRNMNIFRYWFRAVEQYAPWVNKIFLVTNGTFPKWINDEHPKLVLVKHSDYIPEELLPTFNSRTIELFMHRIKGLSEQFVYFNDDFFLNAPVLPEYYFHDGLPCDCNEESMMNVPIYNNQDKYGIYMSILANIGVLNANFDRQKTVHQSLRRWYGFHLGKRGLLLSYMLRRSKKFIGFQWRHFEQPFLKSVIEDAWEKAPEQLLASCTKFRGEVSLTPYFFRYWQFATNRFYPVRLYKSIIFNLRLSKLDKVERALHNSKVISLCFNDTANCPDDEYYIINRELQGLLEKKFPLKSAYEKGEEIG